MRRHAPDCRLERLYSNIRYANAHGDTLDVYGTPGLEVVGGIVYETWLLRDDLRHCLSPEAVKQLIATALASWAFLSAVLLPEALVLSNHENEPWRQLRLAAVAVHIIFTDSRAVLKIASLHDHKGVLIVRSRRPLSIKIRSLIRWLWREIGHEPPECVEFEVGESERVH